MGTAGCVRLLLGWALMAALSGCLQDAQNKSYDFTNTSDTTQSTGSTETGNVKIVLVKPSSPEIVVIVNLSAVFDVPMVGWTLGNNSTCDFTRPPAATRATTSTARAATTGTP
jgi:hypothetical protein